MIDFFNDSLELRDLTYGIRRDMTIRRSDWGNKADVHYGGFHMIVPHVLEAFDDVRNVTFRSVAIVSCFPMVLRVLVDANTEERDLFCPSHRGSPNNAGDGGPVSPAV